MKAIDITEKLNFEEKPTIKIKDTVLSVNNEAVAILEIVSKISDKVSDTENMTMQDIKLVCDALFDEENRRKLADLHLGLIDYMTVVQSAMELIAGKSSGETPTPATT